MNINDKIYIAGHRGLVGSAVTRALKKQGYTNFVERTHAELELTDQRAVAEFFTQEKPDYVVLAAANYPDESRSGDEISGLTEYHNKPDADVLVFHAGTAELDRQIVGNGGRVLNIVGLGTSVSEARERAYAAVDVIRRDDGFCRRDIGWRALKGNL